MGRIILNKTDFLILGLLHATGRKMYGYEMMNLIEEMGINEWSGIRPASIYKAFERLEEKAYIQKNQEISGKNPPRNVYCVLEAGAKAYQKAIVTKMQNPKKDGREFLIGLSFMEYSLTIDDFYKAMNKEIKVQEAVIAKEKETQKKIANLEKQVSFQVPLLVEMGKKLHEVLKDTYEKILEEALKPENEKYFKKRVK